MQVARLPQLSMPRGLLGAERLASERVSSTASSSGRAERLNRLLGRITGRRLLRVSRLDTSPLSRELENLIDGLAVDHVLDVGAHVGRFRDLLRNQVGFQGWITSFEPTPGSLATLRERAAGDRLWNVEQVGLGSHEGSAELSLFESAEMNSLHAVGECAGEYWPGLAPIDTTTVSIRRLDAVWAELKLSTERALLKVDTQGHDLEVVRGGLGRHERIAAVLMEVAVTPLYESAPRMAEVLREMDSFGFELTGAFPVHRFARGLRVVEFDCTFVNRAFIL